MLLDDDDAPFNQVLGLDSNKRKRIKASQWPLSHLHNDLIFNILVYIPAKTLYNKFRFVNWEYYHLLKNPDFVKAHFKVAPIGAFVEHPFKQRLAYYVETTRNVDRLETSLYKIPFPTKPIIRSSLNGLVLLQDKMNKDCFYIVNPVTGFTKSLLPVGCPTFKSLGVNDCHAILACTREGRYKVVICTLEGAGCIVLVCTVGVDDAWIFIDNKLFNRNSFIYGCRPKHCVSGILYWFVGICAYAMDMDTYMIREFDPPCSYTYDEGGFVGLATGCGYICYKDNTAPLADDQVRWVVYELTDVIKDEWIKVIQIDMTEVCRNYKLGSDFLIKPLFYSKETGELWLYLWSLIYEHYRMVVYNTRTRNLLFFRCIFGTKHSFPLVSSLSFQTC